MVTAKKRTHRDQTHAILTLRGADKWSAKGRRDIAAWLRDRARDLEQHGDQLAGTFRARYLS